MTSSRTLLTASLVALAATWVVTDTTLDACAFAP